MTTIHNDYPDEFDEWVVKNGYSNINGEWWLWPEDEKQYIWICNTTDELYQIYLKEKKH